MATLQATVENLERFTPEELNDRRARTKTSGNKAAFLRAASGCMSSEAAARLRKLIDESCERIDE